MTDSNGSVTMSSNFTSSTKTVPGATRDDVVGTRSDPQDERTVVGITIGDDLALVGDGCVHEYDVAGVGAENRNPRP